MKDSHPSWDMNIVAPLLYTRLDFKNLVSDTLYQTDNQKFISLIYENTLYNLNADSIVDLPDTISDISYPLPFSGTVNPGTQFINQTEEVKFSFGDAEISKIILKKGIIHFKATNTVDEPVILDYQIPSAMKNGIIFGISEKIPAGVNNTAVFQKDFDISGYEFNMTGISGGKANTIITSTQISTDPNGNPVYVVQSDKISISITFNDLKLDYAKGYLGSAYYESNEENAKLKLFSDVVRGTLNLEQVNLTLDIENGFGIDLRMLVKELIASNTKTGISVASDASIINNPVNINRAVETFNPASPVIPVYKHFDFSNSNIKDMFENLPNQVTYAVNYTTNPLGNVSSGNDFIYGGQRLKADLKLEIPLSLATNQLTITDTSDFALAVADNAVNSSSILDGSIQFSDIGSNGATSGQVIKWNGYTWAAAPDLGH